MAYLKEEEGFITPLKGFKAIALNAILNKSFGLTTKEMIVLDISPVEIYTVARALYKYYGFKKNLPGYDYKSQETFKKVYGDFELRYYVENGVVIIKELAPRELLIDLYRSLLQTYKGVPYRNKLDLLKIKLLIGD